MALVGAEHADEREHEVLGLDAFGQGAVDLDAERLGHPQPRLSAGHPDGDVRAAHACRERTKSAAVHV